MKKLKNKNGKQTQVYNLNMSFKKYIIYEILCCTCCWCYFGSANAATVDEEYGNYGGSGGGGDGGSDNNDDDDATMMTINYLFLLKNYFRLVQVKKKSHNVNWVCNRPNRNHFICRDTGLNWC